MSLKIKHDHARFREIVRGRIQQNLRKYIPKGELIGKKGKDFVSIPVPTIDIPHFRFGERAQGGVGQGEGEPGDPLSPERGRRQGPGGPGRGAAHPRGRRLPRRAGRDPRRGAGAAAHRAARPASASSPPRDRYTGIRRRARSRCATSSAPSGRRSGARSPSGTYNSCRPVVVPVREDRRYRTWKVSPAARDQRRHHLHDGRVRLDGRRAEGDRPHRVLLDRHLAPQATTRASRPATSSTTPPRARSTATPSSTRASPAAPMISSAYELCARDHRRPTTPPTSWNIYPFHFSDGDNWSADDTALCVEHPRGRASSPRSTCSATARWRAPTAPASSSRTCTSSFGERRERGHCREIADKDGDLRLASRTFLGQGALMADETRAHQPPRPPARHPQADRGLRPRLRPRLLRRRSSRSSTSTR